MFKCERCNYSTTSKSDFKKHLSRKIPCEPVYSSKPLSEILLDLDKDKKKDFVCEYCNKGFSSSSSRSHHKARCPSRPQNEKDDLKEQVKDLQQKLESLQKLVEKNNESHTVHNVNVQINNIGETPLREFGSENMEAIPITLIASCFMNLRYRDLIENLHYDPDFPENHNVRIKSIKRNVMEIYRNNRWVVVTVPSGIEELINQTTTIFRNFARQHEKQILEEDMSEEEFESNMTALCRISKMDKLAATPVIRDIQTLLETHDGKGALVKK